MFLVLITTIAFANATSTLASGSHDKLSYCRVHPLLVGLTRNALATRDSLKFQGGRHQMTNSSTYKGRVLLQQCLGAELRTGQDGSVRIGRGVVAFVCFMRGADSTTINRMAKIIISAALSETPEGFKSVVGLPGDILVVPQATLGGKSKGKTVQYHNNAPKAEANVIYCAFVKTLTDLVPDTRVEHGAFGERQVLAMDNTCGPFSHCFDVE